jgi:hypothetical protein
MWRLTGADGFAGIVLPAGAAVWAVVPELGAAQPVMTMATTAAADAK